MKGDLSALGTADLSRRIARGAAWMVLLKGLERSLGLVSTVVLARLLVPGDFGLVAMATSLLAMVEVLSWFSFDIALIQNQKAGREHYDTAWTFNVLFGAGSAAMLALLAVPAAAFFGDPRVTSVVYCLAAAAFIQGFQNVGIVAFRKELDFRKEFAFMAFQKLVAVATALILAFVLRSYWALVSGILVSKVLSVGVSYAVHPYRPRLSVAASRDLMHFSAWMFVSNLTIFGAVKGYDFIVGRIAGAHALGLYSVAYEISNLPTTELVYPVSRAVFPGFSRLAERRADLQRMFVQVSALTALFAIPAGCGVALLAGPLVRLLLGPQWIEAVPMIQILAVYGVLRAAQAGTGDVYLALGVHRYIALVNLCHIVIGWPLMVYLYSIYGMAGAVSAVLCASLFGVTLNFAIVLRVLRLRAAQLACHYWRPLAAVACMAILEWALLRAWPPSEHVATLLMQTAAYVVSGAAIYGGLLMSLWLAARQPDGPERWLLQQLLPKVLARFGRAEVCAPSPLESRP